MEQPTAHDPVRRDLSETERRWQELITELDAVDRELLQLQPPDGGMITPEIFDRIEAARQRRHKLHAAMIDFLDTLDDMPP